MLPQIKHAQKIYNQKTDYSYYFILVNTGMDEFELDISATNFKILYGKFTESGGIPMKSSDGMTERTTIVFH